MPLSSYNGQNLDDLFSSFQNENLTPKRLSPPTARPTSRSSDIFEDRERIMNRKNSNSQSSNSGSTPSLPISIPYYYIANNTNSFDTVNMLPPSAQPQYSNTSHLNMPMGGSSGISPAKVHYQSHLSGPQEHQEQQQHHGYTQQQQQQQQQHQQAAAAHMDHNQEHPAHLATAGAGGAGHARNDSTGPNIFNQVPKRFSQFILDQQNPYMAQRLDHLSMNSISLYSGGTPSYMDSNKQHNYHSYSHYSGDGSRTRGAKQGSNGYSGNPAGPGSATTSSQKKKSSTTSDSVNRDISDSMGSQATIFSTRPHDVDNNTLRSSNLKRRKAVRAKEGSVMYRIQLRLRKLAKKMKYIFRVKRKKTVKPIGPTREKRIRRLLRRRRSKKTPSGAALSASDGLVGGAGGGAGAGAGSGADYTGGGEKNMKKSLSLGMGLPKSKSKIINISAPTQNLDLGRGSELVPMDSRLKFRAGLQDGNANELIDLPNEDDSIKRKTLSPPAIVPSSSTLPSVGKFTTRKAPPPPGAPGIGGVSNTTVGTGDKTAGGDLGSPMATATPTLSQNLLPESMIVRKSLHAPILHQMEEDHLIEVWKNYLSHVIASRIKLRQEINFYQSLKKESNYKFGIETEDESSQAGGTRTTSSATDFTSGTDTSAANSKRNLSSPAPAAAAAAAAAPAPPQAIANAAAASRMNSTSSSAYSNSIVPPSIPRVHSTPPVQHKLSVRSFAPTIGTTPESDEDNDSTISILDPTEEEFNRSFANRHSVLGEMLDYASDATSVASSSVATESTAMAIATAAANAKANATAFAATTTPANTYETPIISDEDLGIGMRYGTVRRTSPSKRSKAGSAAGSFTGSFTRLQASSHHGSDDLGSGRDERGSSSNEKSGDSTISIQRFGEKSSNSIKRSQGFKTGLNSVAAESF